MKYIGKSFNRICYLALIIMTIITVSCEEVIDIELNSAKPALVAEGLIEKIHYRGSGLVIPQTISIRQNPPGCQMPGLFCMMMQAILNC